MYVDLQHPPEVIPAIIEKFEEGYEVVSMVRISNADASVIHKLLSGMFYKMLNVLSHRRNVDTKLESRGKKYTA